MPVTPPLHATTFACSPALTFRMVAAVTAAALRRSRGDTAGMEAPDWTPATPLGDEGLALDSLERMEVAGRLNEQFHLHETGIEDRLLMAQTLGDWVDVVRDAWRLGAAHLTFATSGSTGPAKRCTHRLDALAEEADVFAARFADRRRVLALVPGHHIYGFLFTVLLPERLGVPVVPLDPRRPFALARALQPGDLVVAFPERWSFVARAVPSFPDDVAGVTSTAPCPPALLRRLAEQGLTRMTEVYGSSETAGLGLREAPEQPYALLPYWTRHPDGRLSRPAPTGQVEAEPMDHLRWVDDRRFVVEGRRDGAVQVGGVNVVPAEVAACLETHPEVEAAAVRPMRPEEGDRLKAFLVPAPGTAPEALRPRLRAWLAEHLPAPARPGALTFGPALPTNEMGKASDW